MKYFIKVGLTVASLAVLTVAAMAGPVTGIWHGNIRFDSSKLPNDPNPNQQKLAAKMIKSQENLKMTLTVKPDHTYSLTVTGGPKGTSTIGGSWVQRGNAITMTPVKAGKTLTPNTFTLSNDTRSFSFQKGPVTMMFFR
jgi:hypothetical protein